MTANWSPTIPGTDVSRQEFILMMRRVYEDRTQYGVIDPAKFNIVSRAGVLTVIQLAALYGISRQSMYVRLWKAGIPMPQHTTRGYLDCRSIDVMELAVKACVKGEPIPPEAVRLLRSVGSHSLIAHLTGIVL